MKILFPVLLVAVILTITGCESSGQRVTTPDKDGLVVMSTSVGGRTYVGDVRVVGDDDSGSGGGSWLHRGDAGAHTTGYEIGPGVGPLDIYAGFRWSEGTPTRAHADVSLARFFVRQVDDGKTSWQGQVDTGLDYNDAEIPGNK